MRCTKKISLILVLFSFLLIGCNNLKNDIIKYQPLHIGFAIDKDSLENSGFTTMSYEGIKRAESDLGAKVTILEGQAGDEDNFIKDFKSLSEKNDLIILVGDRFNSSLRDVTTANRDKKFGAIHDIAGQPNLQDINFKTNEATFLMGLIAGAETNSNNVAIIADEMDVFLEASISGYMSGVKLTNTEAYNKLKSNNNIYLINDTNENNIYELAKDIYNNGVDIILTITSKNPEGVYKAASESGKFALGTVMNQSERYKEYSSQILSSSIIKADEAAYKLITEVNRGTFKSGQGNGVVYGIKEGYIDYSSDTKEKVTENTMNILVEYKEKITNSTLEVPSNYKTVIEFTE